MIERRMEERKGREGGREGRNGREGEELEKEGRKGKGGGVKRGKERGEGVGDFRNALSKLRLRVRARACVCAQNGPSQHNRCVCVGGLRACVRACVRAHIMRTTCISIRHLSILKRIETSLLRPSAEKIRTRQGCALPDSLIASSLSPPPPLAVPSPPSFSPSPTSAPSPPSHSLPPYLPTCIPTHLYPSSIHPSIRPLRPLSLSLLPRLPSLGQGYRRRPRARDRVRVCVCVCVCVCV